jgi:diguanylate cyclase (GGDEF)-like protein/PAS domain S-box-containing protein
MKPIDATTDAVREGLIDGAYRQGQGGMLMNLMAISGIAWLHWLMAKEPLSPPWLTGMLLLTLARGAVIIKVCANPSAYSIDFKERLFVLPLVVTSLLWAALPLLFPTATGDERLALSVVQAGMAGGAASVLAAVNWSARLYLACMLAPASLMLALQRPYGIALTALGLAYLGIMLLAHSQARRILLEALVRLQQNRELSTAAEAQRTLLERLNQELLAAQDRLRHQNSALEKAVAERTAKMRLSAVAIENTAEGVMVLDHGGNVLEVNPGFTRITGYTPEEVIGRSVALLHSPHQNDAFYDEMWSQLAHTGRWEGELWSRTASGGAFLERRSVDAVHDTAGRITHYVTVFNDITEARQKDNRIRHLAYHDALTGLPNRLLLEDRLRQGIALAEREQERLALMFLDLDQFKGVNDGLGHDIGDILLQQVAERIRSRMRSSDTLGRLGGDEFVILLRGVHRVESCAVLAQEIADALAEPIQVLSHRIHIGVSIGIAVYPEDGTDGPTLMKSADTAMYAAKSAGRGTFRYFQPEMSVQAALRLELDLELRQAIEHNELSLHFQPKVDAASGVVEGYEALLRWSNPHRGMIPPTQFIPVAEDSGLISRIGEWILREASRQIAHWHALGLGWQRVAVNVSARQLRAGDLVRQVREAAAQAAIPASLLEIELTESVLMGHPEEAAHTLTALKGLGLTLAIDDFGTGYSSLAYLRRLPIDVLKIDRSFVTESELDANGLAIVKTILALGRTLGMTVVAEGVETQKQALLLRRLGCHQLQGFLFGVPVPGDQITRALKALSAAG